MELQYHKWCEIKIDHSYFVDSYPKINIAASSETSIILRNNNILVQEKNGFIHFYIGLAPDVPFSTSFLENLEILVFEVLINDTLFFNYTNLDVPILDKFYVFKNIEASTVLQREAVTDEKQAKKLKDNSLGILQINPHKITSENLIMSFETRKVFYQYQIVIARNSQMEVIDMHIQGFNQEAYTGPVEELLPTGDISHVYTSPSPLALQEILEKNPVLKLIYKTSQSNNKQELQIKLPNPSAENLKRNKNGELAVNTIVYV